MSTFVKDLGDITEKFYSRFVLRDMTYVVSGLLIVYSVINSFGLNFNKTDDASIWMYLLFLIACYFIGVINQEAFILLGLFKMYPNSCRKKRFIVKESNCIKNLIELTNSNILSTESYKFLERIIVHKHYTTSIGSASLISLILIFIGRISCMSSKIINDNFYVFIVALFLISIVCIFSNWKKSSIQERIIDKLL